MAGYRAVQNDDGTWNVLDVPIFAEVREQERGNKDAVGRAWMEAALVKAKLRFTQDGYLAPLHVHHTGDAVPKRRAGHFMPRRVARAPYEGEPRWTLYADFLQIPQVVFNEIESGDLPYRSVEFKWDTPPEIHSLALLPDDVPFFRFELLTIADKTTMRDEPAPERLPETEAPAVAFAHAGAGTMVLFRFREEQSMEPNEPGSDPGAATGEPTIADVLMAIQALPEAIVSAMSGGQMADDDSTPAEPDKKEELADDEKEKKDEEMSAGGEVHVAKLTARLDGVEQKLSARDQADAEAALVATALGDLKEWHVPDSTRASLATFAAQGKPVLDAFVSEYKINTPKTPPATFADMDAMGGANGDCPEVAKYTAQGPDVLAKARAADAMFRELKDNNKRLTFSREQFLIDNVGPVGGES